MSTHRLKKARSSQWSSSDSPVCSRAIINSMRASQLWTATLCWRPCRIIAFKCQFWALIHLITLFKLVARRLGTQRLGRTLGRTHQLLKRWIQPERSRWSPYPAWTWLPTTISGGSKRLQTIWLTVLLWQRQRSQRYRHRMVSGSPSAFTKPHTLTCSERTYSHESSSMSFYKWVTSRKASPLHKSVGRYSMNPPKHKRVSTR